MSLNALSSYMGDGDEDETALDPSEFSADLTYGDITFNVTLDKIQEEVKISTNAGGTEDMKVNSEEERLKEQLKPTDSASDNDAASVGSEQPEGSLTRLKGLVSYGDDDDDDDDESLSDMEIEDTEEMPLSKDDEADVPSVSAPSTNSSAAASPLKQDEEDEKDGSTPRSRYANIKLPPEPEGRCSKSLQDKIAKMIERKNKTGWDVNRSIQDKKAFRNPMIYEKLISFIGIDEHGTNYPKYLYDPTIWTEDDAYEALAKKQKEFLDKKYRDKKEKDRAKGSQIEFVTGSKKLPGSSVPVSSASTVLPIAINCAPPLALTSQSLLAEKRSKWDIGPPGVTK